MEEDNLNSIFVKEEDTSRRSLYDSLLEFIVDARKSSAKAQELGVLLLSPTGLQECLSVTVNLSKAIKHLELSVQVLERVQVKLFDPENLKTEVSESVGLNILSHVSGHEDNFEHDNEGVEEVKPDLDDGEDYEDGGDYPAAPTQHISQVKTIIDIIKDEGGMEEEFKIETDQITSTDNLADSAEIPSNNENLYKCNDCDYSTETKRYLKYHQTTHQAAKYRCEICSITKRKIYEMKRHMKKVHGVRKVEYLCENENFEVRHYLCRHCHYSNTKLSALTNHLKIKHKHTDGVCDKNCTLGNTVNKDIDDNTDNEEEEENLLEKDDGKEYSCDKCIYKTTKLIYFQDHIAGSGKFKKCLWCNKHFTCDNTKKENNRLALRYSKHLQKEHESANTAYKCLQCLIIFKSVKHLEQHVVTEHQLGIMFHCDQCTYSSHLYRNLKLHKETHGEANFPCPDCSHLAKSSRCLNKHVYERHTIFPCTKCCQEFQGFERYMKHTEADNCVTQSCNLCNQSQHKNGDAGGVCQHVTANVGASVIKPVAQCCDICGNTFSSRQGLHNHKINFHSNVDFACKQCDYKTNRRYTLNQHVREKHKNIKYSCEYCEYITTLSGNLKKHIEIKHLKIRYSCDYCDVSCASDSALRRHMSAQHGIGKVAEWRCQEPDCDYVAKQEGNLKAHVNKVHEGIRFSCDDCNYSTGYLGDLTRHIKVVHKGQIHKCDMCEYTTPKKYYLKAHMLKNHNRSHLN